MDLGNGVKAYATYNHQSGRLDSLFTDDKALGNLQTVTYTFDVLGNLKSHHDQSHGVNLKETFNYDLLNRLENVLLSGSVIAKKRSSRAKESDYPTNPGLLTNSAQTSLEREDEDQDVAE